MMQMRVQILTALRIMERIKIRDNFILHQKFIMVSINNKAVQNLNKSIKKITKQNGTLIWVLDLAFQVTLVYYLIHYIYYCKHTGQIRINWRYKIFFDIWCHIFYKKEITKCMTIETSLLRRLQATTLSDATPRIGKIRPSSKIVVTF